MKSILKRKTTSIISLLLLTVFICSVMQAAMATENTLTMSIGDYADIGTDPTLDSDIWPDAGGVQEYHYFTHYSPLITLDSEGEIISWLSESYEISDNYKTITFHVCV